MNKLAGFEDRFVPKIPKIAVKAGTSVLEWWSDHISHKPPLSTPKEIEYSSQYLFFDNAKAKQELGLNFNPVEDSLMESIKWFRKMNYAP